jgi:FtsZ-binding cell division protein ZapB
VEEEKRLVDEISTLRLRLKELEEENAQLNKIYKDLEDESDKLCREVDRVTDVLQKLYGLEPTS